jgi:hypothetical protein
MLAERTACFDPNFLAGVHYEAGKGGKIEMPIPSMSSDNYDNDIREQSAESSLCHK